MMSLGLETIEFKRIPKEATQAANFLRDHVQGRVKTRGSQIQVEGAKHRELKLLLHKFLRHRGLEGYRVLSQSGVLEVVPQHVVESAKEETGTPPAASATMPYFFPGSPTLRVEKKVKKTRDT